MTDAKVRNGDLKNMKLGLLVGRAIEIQRELDVRKLLYKELDQVLLELAELGFRELEWGDLIYKLTDNFKEKNTGWTSSAVRRFELKAEKKETEDE